MTCTDDSCDLVHCKRCGCHTAGNILATTGLCHDCFLLEEDAYQKYMEEKYRKETT